MIGIGTNVVVRLVVADDAEQTRRARKLIDQALGREALFGIFRALLEARGLSFEDEPALEEALFDWKDSACGLVCSINIGANHGIKRTHVGRPIALEQGQDRRSQ